MTVQAPTNKSTSDNDGETVQLWSPTCKSTSKHKHFKYTDKL